MCSSFCIYAVQFNSVQMLSCVWLFATSWTAACQASLSITNSRSPTKPMSIESVMPSSHLILSCPLLLLPPIPSSIRVFSNESTLCIRGPKYWSISFSITSSKEIQGLISLQSKGLSRVSTTTVQKHQFFSAQLGSYWKKKKKNTEELQNNQKANNKIVTSTYLSIITLNNNGINAPIKRQRMVEWI